MRRVAVLFVLTGLSSVSTYGATATAPAAEGRGSIMKRDFGAMPDGTRIDQYVLTNGQGMKASVITYGAILTELTAPDRNGKWADVVLGFDDLEGYLKTHPFFGATVGRVANRIAKGRFTLDGKEYKLA